MSPRTTTGTHLSRRTFLAGAATGLLGRTALASMMPPQGTAATGAVKRAVWLFMAGGPSQLDLFDYKPGLDALAGQDLPTSVLGSQRLTTMTSGQQHFPVAPSAFAFSQHGQSGGWVSSLLPFMAKSVDDIAIIRTVQTDAINHEPATLFINSGSELPGKASVGAWLSYGLGSLNQNLPTFVVMTSRFPRGANAQALSSRLWGSAFLPVQHAGVALRSSGDPILYLPDPPGVDRTARRTMLDALNAVNRIHGQKVQDPETDSRIEQYESAFRLQSAVPELTDVSKELDGAARLYGEDVRIPGTFASNCLLARRMLERGVRFIQIYHRGWDSHAHLPTWHPRLCQDIDRPCHGFLEDLKNTGLLDDTLVIWGGEFGRTVYSQGELTRADYGRDHHARCFSMWLAGGGIKPGVVFGETDDFGFNVVEHPVHLRDIHATVLQQFGLDADRFGVIRHGLQERLIGVGTPARVVREIVAR